MIDEREKGEMSERKRLLSERTYGPAEIEWIKSDWFCMVCGKQDVWQAADDGDDYEHGYSAKCHSCGYERCCVDKLEPEDPK